jgi:hypothetical protein
MLVDLEALLAERVIDRLQLTNGRLKQVVIDALDREIDRLGGERDDANSENRERSSNGKASALEAFTPPATKVCTSCGQEKPAGKFERHRRVCKSCRWQAERERRNRTEQQDDPFVARALSLIGERG